MKSINKDLLSKMPYTQQDRFGNRHIPRRIMDFMLSYLEVSALLAQLSCERIRNT